MSNAPKGWSRIPLRDACELVQYGYTASASAEPLGPKFLRITDIVPPLVDWASVPYCKMDDKKRDKYTLAEGDIVIARTGATTGYAKRIKSAPPSVFASYLVRIRVREGFDNRFVGAVVESDEYKRFIMTNIGGAAQPNANAQVLTSFPLLVPPLPTQQKIAAILSAYDDLIENNTRRIKILEEMAQALYREWFVHFRFPGHEGVQMVDSPLGAIPEGWDVAHLADLVETQYGYTESATEEPVGPKFLRGMDINKRPYIDWDTVPYCPISDADYGKFRLAVGDIVVIRMADPGKVGIVETQIEGVFASYLVRLRITSPRLAPYFLFYFLLSDRYQGYITGASTGTTRKSASAGVITGIDLAIPPEAVRDEFEDRVAAIRRLLNNLLGRDAVLRRTRDLLLPKLISGEVNVAGLDIDTGGLSE